MWRYQGTDQVVPRSFYTEAVTTTKAALQDPQQNRTDNLLVAVLLLDFYDTVSGRFGNRSPSEQHQDGALALIKHRGRYNFKTELSKRLLIAIRHRSILAAIERKGVFEYDGPLWEDDGDMPMNPATELDQISTSFGLLQQRVAEISSLQRLINGLDLSDPLYSTQVNDDVPEVSAILQEAGELELEFLHWYETKPAHWRPMIVKLSEIHPSIKQAGAYGQHCEVFPDIHVARVINLYRCTRVLVLQIMDRCCQVLAVSSAKSRSISRTFLANEIQTLVDEVCATIPFHLGNRTMPSSLYNEWDKQYPYPLTTSDINGAPFRTAEAAAIATRLAEKDHIKSAATMGGWSILSVLLAIVKAVRPPPGSPPETPPQLPLRAGQVPWIFGQLRRLQTIYLIPSPSRP